MGVKQPAIPAEIVAAYTSSVLEITREIMRCFGADAGPEVLEGLAFAISEVSQHRPKSTSLAAAVKIVVSTVLAGNKMINASDRNATVLVEDEELDAFCQEMIDTELGVDDTETAKFPMMPRAN